MNMLLPAHPAAASMTNWSHTHPMKEMDRGVKTYWRDGESGQQWKMELYHSKGGMNYSSGKQEAKGIKLCVTPVELSTLDGLMVESSTLLGVGSGYKMHIEDAPRMNRKRLAALAEDVLRPDHDQTAKVISAIVYEQKTGERVPQVLSEEPPPRTDKTTPRANSVVVLTKQNHKDLPPLYSHDDDGNELQAVVKFFHPMSSWSWYAGEFDGEDTFYGVVSGVAVEHGCFTLSELQSVVVLGMGVERDRYFAPRPMSEVYEALQNGRSP